MRSRLECMARLCKECGAGKVVGIIMSGWSLWSFRQIWTFHETDQSGKGVTYRTFGACFGAAPSLPGLGAQVRGADRRNPAAAGAAGPGTEQEVGAAQSQEVACRVRRPLAECPQQPAPASRQPDLHESSRRQGRSCGADVGTPSNLGDTCQHMVEQTSPRAGRRVRVSLTLVVPDAVRISWRLLPDKRATRHARSPAPPPAGRQTMAASPSPPAR